MSQNNIEAAKSVSLPNIITDEFNDCWLKALLYHVFTREDVLAINKKLCVISKKNESVISKNGLIELMLFRIEKADLIAVLQTVVKEKGMPDIYTYLQDMYRKIIDLEPIKVADIYLHLPNELHKDMAMKVFSGENLQKAFNLELITLIFKELLSCGDKTVSDMFEYSVAKNQSMPLSSYGIVA